jgi:hypothetical protein
MVFDCWSSLLRVVVGTLALAALVLLPLVSAKRISAKLDAFDPVALGATRATARADEPTLPLRAAPAAPR